MVHNNSDRRIRKTRRSLQEALLGLLEDQTLASIRINDILERADVGRSTFYLHFESKYDLLNSCFEDIREMLTSHLEEILRGTNETNLIHDAAAITDRIFQFMGNNYLVMRTLVGKEGFLTFVNDIQLGFIPQLLNSQRLTDKTIAVPLEMLLSYFTFAFLGVLRWWIEKGQQYSAEEVDEYFKLLAKPSLKEVFTL